MSLKTRILAWLGRRREAAAVDASFAPGQSAWRDALLDEGLDARSFPLLHPDRESPQRERTRPERPEVVREN